MRRSIDILSGGTAMKVAISGAGIAGPTLAYWLMRSGHDPTLIEAAPRLRSGGYIVDFWGVGYAVAERMGLRRKVHEIGYAVDDVRIVDDAGRGTGGFSAKVFARMTGGRFTSLPRGDLAETIHGAVANRVETRFDDEVTGFEMHDAGVDVTFARAPPSRYDLLIGADGLHSRVRGLAFGAEDRFERPLGYHVVAFEARGYRNRDPLTYVLHSRPGRLVSRFSMRDDRTMFLFIYADDVDAHPEERGTDIVKATVHRVFGDAGWECPEILNALDEAPSVYADAVSQIVLDRWTADRVALVGDAAACVSLLAGEGTGLAMAEAYVLAGELKAADGDYPAAFRRYESLMAPLLRAKQQSARRLASAFAPKTAFGVFVRNQATRLLGVPVLAQALVGRDPRDAFELPDYRME
jgi:2-polyprenyl-6-methoxyphenol hydroxylase-like FAD-dependent oxidoreductase